MALTARAGPSGLVSRQILLVGLAARQSASAPKIMQEGASFSIQDTACGTATVTLLGCFNDAAYQAQKGRDLPYNLPGCFGGDEQPWCKSAPSPPPCIKSQLDNEYCAKGCVDWAPRIPGADPDELYMSTQAGFACFCGTIAEGEKATQPHNKLPLATCASPCTGSPGEKCGGQGQNLVFRVTCGSNWGLWFLLMVFLGASGYIGGFVLYAHKVKGVPLSKAALPHPEFWLQFRSLVTDGVEFTKLRIREQQGYTALPSSGPDDSGDDTKDLSVQLSVESEKTQEKTSNGVFEERDESVHPSKAPIRVVVKPSDAEEAGGASSDRNEDEELVE